MATIWTEWVWTMKRYAGLYPLTFIQNAPSATKTGTSYTILTTDQNLVFSGSSAATWTLFEPSATDTDIYELHIKNRGTANLTVSGAPIFIGAADTGAALTWYEDL